MNRRPLALDDRQLGIVMAAARGICACDRDRFLHSVSDQLATIDNFSDAEVACAVTVALLHLEAA